MTCGGSDFGPGGAPIRATVSGTRHDRYHHGPSTPVPSLFAFVS